MAGALHTALNTLDTSVHPAASALLYAGAALSGMAIAGLAPSPTKPGAAAVRSVPVEPATDGQSAVYRNGRIDELCKDFQGARSVREAWERTVEAFATLPCAGQRERLDTIQQEVTFTNREGEEVTRKTEKWIMSEDFTWQTYEQVHQRVLGIAAGLGQLFEDIGHPVEREGANASGRVMGIFADTSPEWMQVCMAAARTGVPLATVYATLGVDAVAYAVTHTSMNVLVVDAALLGKAAELPAGRKLDNAGEEYNAHCRSLKAVVCIGEPSEEDVRAAERAGLVVMTLDDLRVSADVEDFPGVEVVPDPSDIAVVMFTSGTTGLPKGVVITHSNLCGAVAGLGGCVPDLDHHDSYLAYLPLAHVLELAAELTVLAHGGRIGYGSKDTLVSSSPRIPVPRPGVPAVKGDAAALAPTVMAAVPAVMEKIRAGVNKKVASRGGLLKTLFDIAYKQKSAAMARGNTTPFWNWLLFDRIKREALGPNLRAMLSGGGPLNGETQEAMGVVLGVPVGQGYGLTETCGCGTIVWLNDRTFGRAGAPVLSCDIKLMDWEEGGYTTDSMPPRGEVCISGACVAEGYYNAPEQTREVFVHEDGRMWFRTGDIGEMDAEGVLRIIDRKKDLVKLSHGEYISLGKMESVYSMVDSVSNIAVHGHGENAYCVALVVPDVDACAAKHGTSKDMSLEDAAHDEDIRAAVLKDIKAMAKKKGLGVYEIPRKIALVGEEWTPDNVLTASMKLRRKVVYKRYSDKLDELYE